MFRIFNLNQILHNISGNIVFFCLKYYNPDTSSCQDLRGIFCFAIFSGMAPRKRKNSAPLFSSDRKGQPSFSLSQPPLSRSTNHDNTSLSTDKCKHPGDVSMTNKEINLLCYQCDKFIGSTDDKSDTKNYVFSCSVCQSSFHGDCLDFDPDLTGSHSCRI